MTLYHSTALQSSYMWANSKKSIRWFDQWSMIAIVTSGFLSPKSGFGPQIRPNRWLPTLPHTTVVVTHQWRSHIPSMVNIADTAKGKNLPKQHPFLITCSLNYSKL